MGYYIQEKILVRNDLKVSPPDCLLVERGQGETVINNREIRQHLDWTIKIKTTYERQMDIMCL